MSVMLGGIDPNVFAAMMGGKNKDMGDVFANMNKDKEEEPKEEPKKREPTPEKKKAPPKKQTSSDPAEALKNEGNEFYKKKDFEAAL